MHDPAVARQLDGAQLWTMSPGPDDPDAPKDAAIGRPTGKPVMIAGREAGTTFCAVVCTTDVGLAFCGRCPADLVADVIARGRAGSARCPAGVRMLAFPVPGGSPRDAAVLRVGPPLPREAIRVAESVAVPPDALRRAARRTEAPAGRVALAAARLLRTRGGLLAWQADQRRLAAESRRRSTAALAQMVAIGEDLHELHRESERQQNALRRNERLLDRLARETLRAKDQERARIAHQIHDTAAQSLVSARRFLEAARSSTENLGDPVRGHLDAAADRLLTAIGETRAVLDSLVPPGLEELGLATALVRRVAELTDGSGTSGEVVGQLPRLIDWVEQGLYGMAAEAVSNAVRHGAASRVVVELGVSGDRAVVSVRDDGRGFDPARTGRRTSGGLGLVGLTRQAGWLGGRASIRSAPGRGTTIRISIPLGRHVAATGSHEPTIMTRRARGAS